uniref:Variant surface glycoprotein 472 n=1 Tax=Trypanosoma brucei TaxID=5691 RepID=M4T1T1_9TRYP|nr:variant surface glycoprotein 472 [Trypanosoma brucei]
MQRTTALLFLVAAAMTATGDDKAFKEAGIATLCTLSATQKSVAGEVTAAITARRTKLEEILALQGKVPLMQIETGHYQLAGASVALALKQIADSLTTGIQKLEETGIPAAAANSYAAGRIDEFATLVEQTKHEGTASNTCIEPTDGVGNNVNPASFTGCATTDFKKTTATTTATTAAAAQQLPTDGQLKGKNANCKLTTQNGQGITGGGAGASLKLIDGFYQHSTSDDWTTARVKTAKESPTLNNAKTQATELTSQLGDDSPAVPRTAATMDDLINNEGYKTTWAAIIQSVKGLDRAATGAGIDTQLNEVFGAKLPNNSRPFTSLLKSLTYALDKKNPTAKTAFFDLNEEQSIQLFQKKLRDLTTKAAQETKLECPSQPNGNADCKGFDKADKCDESPKCSWHAKVKDGEANCQFNETKAAENKVPVTQAKTGGTVTVKCSEYGSKDKCEEVNKGKDKPVCGWRKGKDNEDDKGTEKCRNGSFLVNKQFALSMVSAAFVALLF